ncbi:RPM1 interacting protein 13 [Oryza sativa Japonica Group]|uniref:Uncharacterized protein n=5 Tax=Oryza TaxID=4527 RepID=A0A5S6RBC7_ORYSJ|nr:uncharacterized protein LOC9271643 [Oryza sativa Japonica Group]XP_052134572.1 RPM1 interacting protein 13 [Oryza glaberrima]KAB8113799.1 hypothetical protein EE612_052926 [Oryza sativa]AAK00442.1 hypothetical protein [Oryza sativa Japonica Group]EAZ17060.1 hypothetical protein OsJ_32554 [Oryza sativa Japonica Group]KAF2914942.1 hypothetical protein DAI22_10g201900 [Oryza sativa Japonica Group]BAT12176.1 Os10g0573300 [Oryza sativa Japonica Group]
MAKPKTRGRRSAPAPPPPPTPPPPPAPPANVIDLTSSPDASTTKGGGSGNRTKRAPPSLLDIELDGIEMWTPGQKRRLDEDCCILSADPLSPDVVAATAAAAANDDVAVVAERGKVACRDYPHPRSACAKFPFGTTPHDDHCEQCFCYVCDVPAPCSSWKGEKGHCHASDKDKKWKVKRTARQKRTQVVK